MLRWMETTAKDIKRMACKTCLQPSVWKGEPAGFIEKKTILCYSMTIRIYEMNDPRPEETSFSGPFAFIIAYFTGAPERSLLAQACASICGGIAVETERPHEERR